MNIINAVKPMAKYLTASLLLLSLSMGVMAKPGLYKQLDLSSDQKQQLKEMRGDKKQKHKAFKASMKAIKQKSITLLDNYSESEAKKIAQEISAIVEQKTLARLAHQNAVYAILNDEQKQKYKKLLSEQKMPFEHKKRHGKSHH